MCDAQMHHGATSSSALDDLHGCGTSKIEPYSVCQLWRIYMSPFHLSPKVNAAHNFWVLKKKTISHAFLMIQFCLGLLPKPRQARMQCTNSKFRNLSHPQIGSHDGINRSSPNPHPRSQPLTISCRTFSTSLVSCSPDPRITVETGQTPYIIPSLCPCIAFGHHTFASYLSALWETLANHHDLVSFRHVIKDLTWPYHPG